MLHRAARSGREEVVMALLENGAGVKGMSIDCFTPISATELHQCSYIPPGSNQTHDLVAQFLISN